MSSADRAAELVVLLNNAGVRATADPRSAITPCVLVTPPSRRYDLACGYSATWTLAALVAPPATLDAFAQLDDLVDKVAGVVDVETAEPSSYQLTGGDLLPAYLIRFTETSG